MNKEERMIFYCAFVFFGLTIFFFAMWWKINLFNIIDDIWLGFGVCGAFFVALLKVLPEIPNANQ